MLKSSKKSCKTCHQKSRELKQKYTILFNALKYAGISGTAIILNKILYG